MHLVVRLHARRLVERGGIVFPSRGVSPAAAGKHCARAGLPAQPLGKARCAARLEGAHFGECAFREYYDVGPQERHVRKERFVCVDRRLAAGSGAEDAREVPLHERGGKMRALIALLRLGGKRVEGEDEREREKRLDAPRPRRKLPSFRFFCFLVPFPYLDFALVELE